METTTPQLENGIYWVESSRTKKEGSISVEIPDGVSWSVPFSEIVLPILQCAKRQCQDPLRKADLITTFSPENHPLMKAFADIEKEQAVKVRGAIAGFTFSKNGKRVEFDQPVIVAITQRELENAARRYPGTSAHITALGTILHELGEINYKLQHPEFFGQQPRTASREYNDQQSEREADRWALEILRKELTPDIRLSPEGYFILP